MAKRRFRREKERERRIREETVVDAFGPDEDWHYCVRMSRVL